MTAWKWTKQKRKCLDMFFLGASQAAIAQELGFHRNTISAWVKHPIFMAEVRQKVDERKTSGKLRRLHSSLSFRQRIERLASDNLKALEGSPRDTMQLRVTRELLHEYRQCATEERIETGEAEKRILHIEENRNPDSKPLTAQNFKEALLAAARAGVIDVKEVMASDNPEESLKVAVQQILANDEKLLDSLHAKDKPVEEEVGKK